MNLSQPNQYCGSTPIPILYNACNVKQKDGLTKEEVMRQNYILRLKKIIYEPNFQGQSAGGGNYVYPLYNTSTKSQPKIHKYDTISNSYNNYKI